MPQRVAVIEDDPEMGDYLKSLFKHGGYDAQIYPTPGRFLDSLLRGRPDVAVVDMNLPGMNGRELIRVIRADPETRRMLVVAVSGDRREVRDVVVGLDAGADEYMLKPLDAELLLARVRALLRRSRPEAEPSRTLSLDSVALSLDDRVARCGDKEVGLTRLEFDLLAYLLRNSNRVLTRGTILQSVWGGDPSLTTRTVDKHVESLRRKFPRIRGAIRTVVRVGYVLKA